MDTQTLNPYVTVEHLIPRLWALIGWFQSFLQMFNLAAGASVRSNTDVGDKVWLAVGVPVQPKGVECG